MVLSLEAGTKTWLGGGGGGVSEQPESKGAFNPAGLAALEGDRCFGPQVVLGVQVPGSRRALRYFDRKGPEALSAQTPWLASCCRAESLPKAAFHVQTVCVGLFERHPRNHEQGLFSGRAWELQPSVAHPNTLRRDRKQ